MSANLDVLSFQDLASMEVQVEYNIEHNLGDLEYLKRLREMIRAEMRMR